MTFCTTKKEEVTAKRLRVNGKMANACKPLFFSPHAKLVTKRLRSSCDVIRMECENTAF